MSGSTGGEKNLKDIPVVASADGLRVLGFTPLGSPRAIDPVAFAETPAEGAALSNATPLANMPTGQTAQPGTANAASRADHRHPMPSAADVGAAPTSHGHAMGDITGLQAALDSKANANQQFNISSINGLSAALDAKANNGHGHAIGDVANLQAQLDSKINLNTRGAAGGVATLDNNGKVPTAQLPNTATGASNVNNGTVNGQIPVWNNTSGKYDPATPAADTSKKIPTVERNSPTAISFAEYNNRRIVLTGNAPLTVAASEAGQTGDQSLVFMVKNRHTAVNTITFSAGITVDVYPVVATTGGAVKIAAGGSATVDIYAAAGTLVAEVRGQLV